MGIMKGEYIVRALIERLKREKIISSLINTQNNQGQTPLLLSCITNAPAITQMLLENGADPNMNAYRYNAADDMKRFYAPIHYVCERAQFNLGVLNVLLDHGKTDVNKTNWHMETPLHVAIKSHGAPYQDSNNKQDGYKNSREVVKLLIKRHAKFLNGPNDQNPLHYLASLDLRRNPTDYLDFMKDVLKEIPTAEMRKDLLQQKSDKGTVLHIVASKTFDTPKEKQIVMDTLKYLIETCGVDPTVKDKLDFPVKRNVQKENSSEINEYLTNKIKAANRQRNQRAHQNAAAAQQGQVHMQVIPVSLSSIQIPSTAVNAAQSPHSMVKGHSAAVSQPLVVNQAPVQIRSTHIPQIQVQNNHRFQVQNNPAHVQMPGSQSVINSQVPCTNMAGFNPTITVANQPMMATPQTIVLTRPTQITQPSVFVTLPQQIVSGPRH